MDFSEEEHRMASYSRQVLCSIVSRYPSGISDLELKNEYMKIHKLDIRASNISTELYEMKGTLVDFRTVSGFRIFSMLRKRIPADMIRSHINFGADAPLYAVSPVSVVDANSFCVYLMSEMNECVQYTAYINQRCADSWRQMPTVPQWQVAVNDCYVAYSQRRKYFLRVKVVKFNDTATVMCYLVDLGCYDSFGVEDLRVAIDLGLYLHQTLRSPKYFKRQPFAIRCYLGSFFDINRKPFNGFPYSRTGLHIALCGKEEFRHSKLMVRFLAYDSESDAYAVDVFDEDGVTPKLQAAIAEDPAILEKDRFYVMNPGDDHDDYLFGAEDDGRGHRLMTECEKAFAALGC